MIAKEILDQLDKCAADFKFPMLDNGYVYPITQRLNCYSDGKNWVIVIEAVGYNVRAGDHAGMHNCLYVYGNCLGREPGTRNEDFLYPSANAPGEQTFDEEYARFIENEKGTLMLREKVISYDLSESVLVAKEIVMKEDQLSAPDLFRSLLP